MAITQSGSSRPPEVNLNKIFSAVTHYPRATDRVGGDAAHNKRLDLDGKAPLYPHGRDSKVFARHSTEWYTASKREYNSPSNVRVVCLDKLGVRVYYWLGIGTAGGKTGSTSLSNAYMPDRPLFLDSVQQTSANIGLRCLVDPVMSNLEELWLTADLLRCTSDPQVLGLYHRVSGIGAGQVVKDENIGRLVEVAISSGGMGRAIATTFPVLRSIVIVNTSAGTFLQQPARGLEIAAGKTTNTVLKELYPEKRVSVGENLGLLVKQAPDKFPYGYAVCPIPTGDITKFSLGDYRYDEEYLTPFREQKIMAVYGKTATAPTTLKPTTLAETKPGTPHVINSEAPTAAKSAAQEEHSAAEESLTDSIKAMEDAGLDFDAICSALYVYQKSHEGYFARQAPLLPADIRRKYRAIFH
ncbi:hypothetical protein FACS1894208_02440 [Clostridia bacterium]|nr:hypothetical protein FACS1894208_02440 [Clostridia bacterium]